MTDDKLQLGVIVSVMGAVDKADAAMAKVADLGLPTCQVAWLGESSLADGEKLRAAADKYGITITTRWVHPPGRTVWNFTEGPTTIGLVPRATRNQRTPAFLNAARVAGAIGVPSITTHAGFIPEYPGDEDYYGTVQVLKSIAAACAAEGIEFWFETGQETPVTLRRTIEDIGADNVGINLDPANLLMYGKANPVDAVDVFGQYVRGVHAKDGDYPTTECTWGRKSRWARAGPTSRC